jgi:hypothetical protein
MHTRKLGVGRNILRVFEIALFFAVSVLGYGLMIKASSFNSKSKSRDQAPQLQSTPETTGDHRETGFIPNALIVPNQTLLSANHSGMAHAIKVFQALHGKILRIPSYLISLPDRSIRLGDATDRNAFAHNLLQQNPVLLI